MSTTTCVYDVIVVGAGLAGCALALSLLRCAPEVSFLVITEANPTTFKIGESLPPEATRLLHHLHPSLPRILAEQVREGFHVPSDGTASAWGSNEVEERHSILNPYGHGWHLDRVAFDETLGRLLRDLRGEHCVKSGRFIGVIKEGGIWTVEVTESKTSTLYHARWVIDATGRKASLGTKLGARTIKHDDLLAFYAVLSSDSFDEDKDKRTFIESTATGWWYTSLLSRHRRVVVYHTDSTSQTAKLARRRLGFIDLLHEETHHISSIVRGLCYEIDDASGTNFPQCTAAGSSSLSPSGDEDAQWHAVGDAAVAFDPLSAQGMMTALEMGFFVGRFLGARLTGKAVAGVAGVENMGTIANAFEAIRIEYERKKRYYYGIERRFETSFWSRRRVII